MLPWTSITHLADTVVAVPAAIAIAVWLSAGRAWRMAAWWTILFTLGLTLVAATKIAFAGWGIGIRSLDFAGISGHAMRATAIAPVIFFLLLQKSPRMLRILGIMAGLLFGLLVAASRIAVHAHSLSEVVAGCLLGAAISLGFIRIARSSLRPEVNRWIVAASFVALLPVSHAEPAPTVSWIYGVALYLSGHDRPHVRSTWEESTHHGPADSL